MGEKIIYEYCLLRYVPDVEREEFVNVGLMMMSKRYRWLRCEVNVDVEKIGLFFRKCDVERLQRQLGIFMRDDVPAPGLTVEERYRWMAAVKSAVIQTSPSHPGIIPIADAITRAEAARLLDERFSTLFARLVR